MRMALPLFFRSRGRGPADVDRLGAFFGIQTPLLDLSRREIDVEALAQQPADLAQHTLSLGPIPHADMAREDVHSGGEAPGVNVMNIGHAVHRSNGGNGAIKIEILWRSLQRSEEHTTELQSLMRNSSAVFCSQTKQPSTTTSSH